MVCQWHLSLTLVTHILALCINEDWKGKGCVNYTNNKYGRENEISDKSETFCHLFLIARLTVQLFAEPRSGCTRKADHHSIPKTFLTGKNRIGFHRVLTGTGNGVSLLVICSSRYLLFVTSSSLASDCRE